MFCRCKDKIILYDPKYAMEATETWCPKHGYNNDCYMCNIENSGVMFSTELCVKHRSTEFREGFDKRFGPGSITCDRVGSVTIEDCKTCYGTGGCMYGKEEESI